MHHNSIGFSNLRNRGAGGLNSPLTNISLAFFDVQDLFRVLWYARYDLIWMFLTKQRTLAHAGILLSQREVFKHLEYSSRCVLDASHTQ